MKLGEMGLQVYQTPDGIWARADERLHAVDIATLPFPGFATDFMPLAVALLATADGTAIVTENVFDNRLGFVAELNRMGADIRHEGRHAVIRGVERLSAAPVRALDVRAGAALVLAGLAADGETVVLDPHHVDRGYSDLAATLRASAPTWNASATGVDHDALGRRRARSRPVRSKGLGRQSAGGREPKGKRHAVDTDTGLVACGTRDSLRVFDDWPWPPTTTGAAPVRRSCPSSRAERRRSLSAMQDSVTVHMDAPPEKVWALVSDVTKTGRYSPETFEAEWLDGADRPAVGARFRGHVKRNGTGPDVLDQVHRHRVRAGQGVHLRRRQPEKHPMNTWGYRLEPAGDGTDVTEFYESADMWPVQLYWAIMGSARGRTNARNMQTTLERIKAAVEG